MSAPHIVVVATGAEIEPLRSVIADVVICADGGVGAARRAGLAVDTVVGDMDSADPATIEAATQDGTEVRQHPTDKDESDLELALLAAMVLSPSRISVHAASGGRLDHQFANLVVLASPRWEAVLIDGRIGNDYVWIIRGERALPLAVGAPLSLHAIGGPASGVTSSGVEWPLTDETLDPFSARGIANRVSGAVTISVDHGVLLAMSSTG